jgi:hypothetical protein
MIFDMGGSEIPWVAPEPLTTYKEGKNVTKFYTRGNTAEVIAVMKSLAPDRFSCIKEIIACINTDSRHTYRVSIVLKKSFFTRRWREDALVLNYLDDHVFESHRQVEKPKPFNIAQAIG